MKLSDCLFTSASAGIYKVVTDWEERIDTEYTAWELQPVNALTLAPGAEPGEDPYGLFVVKALIVIAPGKTEPCYLEIVIPEGITESVYTQEEGRIVQKDIPPWSGLKAVPAIAIEAVVSEDVYYSRIDPEVGLEVLRKGLATAKKKWPIAQVMATILRCEKRFREAEEAYSIVIAECPRRLLPYNYGDRALVRDALGDAAGAASDREQAERVFGRKDRKHN